MPVGGRFYLFFCRCRPLCCCCWCCLILFFSLAHTLACFLSLSICNYLHCYKKNGELRFHFLAMQRNTDKIGFSVHFQFIRTAAEQAHTHLLVLSFIGYNCTRVYVYSWDFFVTFFIYFSLRSFRFTKFLFYVCWSYRTAYNIPPSRKFTRHHTECHQCDPLPLLVSSECTGPTKLFLSDSNCLFKELCDRKSLEPVRGFRITAYRLIQ